MVEEEEEEEDAIWRILIRARGDEKESLNSNVSSFPISLPFGCFTNNRCLPHASDCNVLPSSASGKDVCACKSAYDKVAPAPRSEKARRTTMQRVERLTSHVPLRVRTLRSAEPRRPCHVRRRPEWRES